WNDQFGTDAQSWNTLDPKRIRNWLNSFEGTSRPAMAAPGLSMHGQARAIDFQVKQNGKIIASTDSKQIERDWRTPKWDLKLKESILAAGPSFRGPLTSPDEPWHYEYDAQNRTATKENSRDSVLPTAEEEAERNPFVSRAGAPVNSTSSH